MEMTFFLAGAEAALTHMPLLWDWRNALPTLFTPPLYKRIDVECSHGSLG